MQLSFSGGVAIQTWDNGYSFPKEQVYVGGYDSQLSPCSSLPNGSAVFRPIHVAHTMQNACKRPFRYGTPAIFGVLVGPNVRSHFAYNAVQLTKWGHMWNFRGQMGHILADTVVPKHISENLPG